MTDLAQDHADLRNLYSRYCFALDYGTTPDLLDCFTEDGVFSLSDRGDFEGHEQIAVIIDASAESRNRHMIMNILIDCVDGDTAEVRAYFLLIRTKDAAVMSYGHYTDSALRCPDGVWRWTAKRIHFDWRDDAYASRSEAQTVDRLVHGAV
jgi:3-phenylpropionate/cinnamic acid dioxygenase small subunit